MNTNITFSLNNWKIDDLFCKQGSCVLDCEIQCPLIEVQSHVRKQIETCRLLSVLSTSCLLGL